MAILSVLNFRDMNDILISVVVPAFNAENFIRECLKSVCEQTYTNFELLVVDDGSTDRTVAVCEDYSLKDSRIRVITKSNGGVSSARNRGIQEAKGEYIVFFDADDYPEKNLLEKYMSSRDEWKNKDIALVMTGMYFDNIVNHNVNDKIKILESAHGYVRGERYILSRSSASTLAWLRLFNFVTNKCYKLSVIRENEIEFDEEVDIAEDLKFNLDYLDADKGNIGFINEPLYHYIRRTKCGLSLDYHASGLDDTKMIYKRFINWETRQQDASKDNVLVVEAIFLSDWINRLTALYHVKKDTDKLFAKKIKETIKKEIKSQEFQKMLHDTFKAKKISFLRYMCLRTGIFEIFAFFRCIYQFMKG